MGDTEVMDNESFNLRLKQTRKKRGYTQEGLAQIANVSVQTIRNYEQGVSKPVAAYLLYLARSLDVTPEYLLLGDDNMNNYTSAVKKELQQLSTFSQIKEIRDKELNSVILSHLEMSEDLVEGIKSEWEQKKIFKKQIKGDDGTTLIEDSYCTRSYVREIILRYCQNRTFFRTKFNIKDGNLF